MTVQRQTGEFNLAAAIRRYFDVALYLLIFTGFGTLASTGRLDLPTVVLVSCGLLFRGYILSRRRDVLLSERWTNLLTIACVAFFIADEFLISRSFLNATVHLVLFVMLVRLFSAQRDRDHYLLAVLSFLMVLAAAVLTADITFLLALGGFILVAVCAIILMEMMHSLERSPVQAHDPHGPRVYRTLSFSVAAIAPLLLALILVGAAGIFFLLPRVSAGYWNAYSGDNDLSTGFSDRVELGRIGQIQQSRRVVMHLKVDGDFHGGRDLKLRGVALNNFDGRNWANTRERYVLRQGLDGRFDLQSREAQTPSGRSVRYRVTMEPFLSDVFFLLPTPQFLRGGYRAVSRDAAGDVFDADSEHPVTRYEAESIVPRTDPPSLRRAGGRYPPDILSSYLQLTKLDPRVVSLAEQITSGASNSFDKASALENYLRTHYSYTLRLSETAPADPIADFLFVRRQGHCEYFASAMAVMLRSVGIPSRVVNGFAGGEFNDLTSQYVIRASDAHSWVEAYFPGKGWVEFDPTPPGNFQTPGRWDRLMLYMDAMSSFWREWVINYDLGHQLRLSQDASRGSRQIVGRMQIWGHQKYERLLAWARNLEDRIGRSTVKWGSRLLAIFLLGLVAAAVPRFLAFSRRMRLARRPERSPETAASIWYERMLRQAAQRGWEKSPSQTPAEFVSTIGDPGLKDRVSDFTDHYENARFGGSAEQASRLPEIYAEIKNSR